MPNHATPLRTPGISGLKYPILKPPIFEVNMMVKSGLVLFIYFEILLAPSQLPAKGQLISKRLLEKLIWTKIATKKFDNFCPGGQIKKIKTLFTLNTP